MKFLSLVFGLMAVAAATPTPTIEDTPVNIEKRATISEAANLGYATQNGG
jgi:pectate lyase